MLLFQALILPSEAQTSYAISDQDSSMTINVNGANAGMASWLVDDVNNVKQQWFYYRGAGGGVASSIDNISTLPTSVTDNGLLNYLDVTYANSAYSAEVKYTLNGDTSGSGHAILGQTVVFKNFSSSAVSFFDYSDYDLAGTLGGQFILITKGNGHQPSFSQTMGSFFLNNSFSSGTKTLSHLEANSFGLAGSGSTLDRLQNQSGTVLDDIASVDSADVTGAMEWDLASGATITISKNVEIQVPEPSAMALIGLGLVVLAAHLRRRC